MPYIDPKQRPLFEQAVDAVPRMTKGQLNFVICELCAKYILENGGLNYDRVADVEGVLQHVLLEFKNRIYFPYERQKREKNGDIRAFEQFCLNEVYIDK